MYHPTLRLYRPLWEVRLGTFARLEPHKLPKCRIAGVAAWETLSLAATATPVCKHKWLCFIRARWLQRNGQVWHGKKKLWSWTSSSSWNMAQVNAVQQSNSTSSDLVVFTIQLAFRGWIEPIYQPLWSGPEVDDITEFYCTWIYSFRSRCSLSPNPSQFQSTSISSRFFISIDWVKYELKEDVLSAHL